MKKFTIIKVNSVEKKELNNYNENLNDSKNKENLNDLKNDKTFLEVLIEVNKNFKN